MNKCNTILAQILSQIPRPEFEKLVREKNAEKYNKGFSAWKIATIKTWSHFPLYGLQNMLGE